MFKIKVADTFVENRSGTSKSGKPYSFNQQPNIYIEINGEVRRFPQIIEEGMQPYQAGNYQLDIEKHCRINDFGSLVIEPYARYQLVPVPVTKVA
jgi:hypothetical protein